MDKQNPIKSSEISGLPAAGKEAAHDDAPQRSLVPKGITIGLATFSLVLSLAGYGFRLAIGDDVGTVLRHAAVIVPAFVLGIPLFFWLGSRVLNKVKGLHIETRNALSLGWLTACVAMLWLMGTYS